MLFLFHHGDIVWKVGLVVLTLISAFLLHRRFDWTWAVFSIPMIAGGWYVALCWLGNQLLPPAGPIDHIPARLIAAAAFPDARDTAVAMLERKPTTNDEDGLAVRAAQTVMSGSCPSAVYEEVGRLREARVLAKLCGHQTRRYDFELGEFEVGEPSLLKALALGRFRDAASMVSDETPCARSLFAYWGGDASALVDLDVATSNYCRVLALVAHDQPVEHDVFPIEYESFADRLGLGTAYSSRLETDQPGAWTVRPDAVGSGEQRVRDLARGTAHGGDLRTYEGREVAVRTGASLFRLQRSGDWNDVYPITTGDVPEHLHVFPEDCSIREPFLDAVRGDGGPIAEVLRRCRLYWPEHAYLEALLPRVKRHRAELAVALRMFRERSIGGSPFRMLDHYARYRDLARLAGDAEEAARWQELVDRFVTVLADRRRAQALAIATIDE